LLKQEHPAAPALRHLLAYSPRIEPTLYAGVFYAKRDLAEQDGYPPLFSEGFLYAAMGKEDARTVLAFLHHTCVAAGLDLDAEERRTYRRVNAGLSVPRPNPVAFHWPLAKPDIADELLVRLRQLTTFTLDYADPISTTYVGRFYSRRQLKAMGAENGQALFSLPMLSAVIGRNRAQELRSRLRLFCRYLGANMDGLQAEWDAERRQFSYFVPGLWRSWLKGLDPATVEWLA
jgi:hypothetical protein